MGMFERFKTADFYLIVNPFTVWLGLMLSAVFVLTGFTYNVGSGYNEYDIQVEQFELKKGETGVFLITGDYEPEPFVREQYTVDVLSPAEYRVKQSTLGAREYAEGLIGDRVQFLCLEQLWDRESNWNYSAVNPSSGAYGIPQSYPAGKMASEGADWRVNPETQIRWGVKYIENRYGSPCAAWEHSEQHNWY